MVDGLTALREAVKGKTDASIKLDGGDIVIGGTKFAQDVDSTWRATGGKMKGSLYKLQDLWFYWQNHGLSMAKYIAKTREAKRTMISNLDAKDLLKYLKGEVDNAAQIESVEASAAPAAKKQKVADGSAKATIKAAAGVSDKDALRKKKPTEKPILDTIFEREIVSLDRTSILSSSNKSFAAVLELFTQAQKKELKGLVRAKELKKAKAQLDRYADKTKTKKSALSDPKNAERARMKEKTLERQIAALEQEDTETRKINEPPIIIVPASASSMITIHNAQDLLEKGAYISTAEIKKAGKAVKKGAEVFVEHSTQNRTDYSIPQKYQVVDNVRRFGPKEWARVVCVFTDGAAWQFKDWKYSTPLEVFAPNHSLGIHLFLDDRPLEPIIKTWNVSRLAISKKKRHLDRILYADFWRQLDEYLIVRRREFVRDLRKSGS